MPAQLRAMSIAMIAMCASLLVAASTTRAHDNTELAAHPGPNGGMVQMSGNFHLEVVLKPDAVNVWVTDHSDTPQKTQGAVATATIFSGAARVPVELRPAAENELHGSADLSQTRGVRVVIDLTMPNAKPLQIRYEIPR